MNPLARLAKVIINPGARLARDAAASPSLRKAADATVGRAARLVKGGVRWYWDIYTHKIPQKALDFARGCEEKGDALCYGKNAPWIIAPGIVLRQSGRAARFATPVTLDIYMSITGVAVLAGAVLAAVWGVPAAIVLGALAFAPAVTAVTLGGTALLMAGGAALAAAPALCSIPTGFRRRKEAFEQEENERSNLEREAYQKLPPLERDLYPYLTPAQTAAPHERVEWFEALKERFPDEFAAAAKPDSDEVSPMLQSDVQLSGPLRLKTGSGKKPGFWGSFRQRAAR